MERRHQVFISSTFADLKDERSEVVQALLELDCFPAGMELFPATSEAAWDLIKGVIDDSDYYCLIIGGRYGSVDDSGMSYTEKEYDYAVSTGKPILAFLHADASKIPAGKSEYTDGGKEKLAAFRSKIEKNHHCKFWSSPEELGGKVSRSLVAIRKSHPSDGWVPGALAADENSRIELANLRTRVAELEAELARVATADASSVATNLASGDDLFTANVYYRIGSDDGTWISMGQTWDTILKYTGPTLLPEASDEEFLSRLQLCYAHAIQKQGIADAQSMSVILPHVVTDQIKIQLRALGYMTPGTKRRAVSDRKTYWKLTSVGEARLLTIQAIQKALPPLPQLELLPTTSGDQAPG